MTEVTNFEEIRGSRVKNGKQLTEGRWYIIHVTSQSIPVHARYAGQNGGYHEFEVLREDAERVPCSSYLDRKEEELRTGIRVSSGQKCEWPVPVYKFKTHPDKLAVTAPVSRKLVPMTDGPYPDIPNGTLFEVVADVGRHFKGSIYALSDNDGSNHPYFKLVSGKAPEDEACPDGICCAWHRLAQIVEVEPEPEQPVLHEIDQIKSEIDALVANATAKRDEAAGLQLAAGKMEAEAEALRQKLADSLSGYLPKKPIPFRSF